MYKENKQIPMFSNTWLVICVLIDTFPANDTEWQPENNKQLGNTASGILLPEYLEYVETISSCLPSSF